jgi:DUF4097 and DUF4098 domain-containing protein YvlB
MRSETFETPGKVKVEVNIPTGDVDIETVDGETTSVQLEVRGDDADEHEREAQIELRRRGDRYEVVISAQKRRFGLNFRGREYNVSVTAPHGTDVEANLASADIEGRGQYGEVRINSASGDVEFEEVAGQARVDSASGDVEMASVDSAKMNSASGDIKIDRTANGADVNTASGDVELRAVVSGEVKVNSASGDIQVGIAKGSRLWVEAQSLSGETSSELELESGAPIESDEGPLVELKARTLSGDIDVRRA